MISVLTKRLQVNAWAFISICGLLALVSSGRTNAACMDSLLHPSSLTGQASPALAFPAVYRPGEAAGVLLPVSDWDQPHGSIVGLWQFTLSGFSVDYGTQAWHADGTEIMFSGGQNPETGDVCQGVWRDVGHSTYTLNHIAMGWMAPGGPFGLRVHIHMTVKLDPSGNTFSGTYSASVYVVSPEAPFDESVMVASGTGNVSATRVRPD
jgi:hypothetical protein